jgi:hypothetical protein
MKKATVIPFQKDGEDNDQEDGPEETRYSLLFHTTCVLVMSTPKQKIKS